MTKSRKRISWSILVAGAIIAMVLSLSVHAVMLQGLHVPYPYNFPNNGWAQLPDGILSVFGAIYLSAHLSESIRNRNLGFRCALLFLLLATIHEVLFRDPFMNFINLSNLTLYPFIDNIPKLIPLVLIAIGVESWSRRKSSFMADFIFALLLAATAGLLVSPFANVVFARVIHVTEAREGVQRYGLPYDWHILLPAYLTFLEPVISALVIGRAIHHQLPSGSATRFGITAALILALRGPLFAPLLNIHFANTGAMVAIVSYAQFTLETMTLGILAAATLHFYFKDDEALTQPNYSVTERSL